MNLGELSSLVNKIHDRAKELAAKKNADYSNDIDVHSNFREVAELCKALGINVATPEGCIQYHIIHKIHRLFKLINEGKTPKNESLFDNSVDCDVYLALLLGIN